MDHKELFESQLALYSQRDLVREDFYEVVQEIRKGMIPRTEIPRLDMLKYKRAILSMIKEKFREEFQYDFTDQELEENRVKNIKGLENAKVTKVISKAIESYQKKKQSLVFYDHGRETQFLDQFNKIQNENETFFISSDPVDLLLAYSEVQTCVSPDGDNIANIFQWLASPYTYIAYSRSTNKEGVYTIRNRSIIYLDYAKKIASIGSIYGSYNLMFQLSIMEWLKNNRYKIALSSGYVFSQSCLYYTESSLQRIEDFSKFFNLQVMDESLNFNEKTCIHSRPYYIDVVGDAITGGHYTAEDLVYSGLKSSRGCLLNEDEEICGDCGEITDSSHFDYDYELCEDCAQYTDRNYCSHCDHHYPDSEFDFFHDECISCVKEQGFAQSPNENPNAYDEWKDEQLLKEEE
jgi:hypothetical protein